MPVPPTAPHLTRRGLAAALAVLPLAGPAAARSPAPPSAHELDTMRLGLMMLGATVERAFARAGVARSPEELTLGQIRELYQVLSRAVEIGPEELRRIEAIVAR